MKRSLLLLLTLCLLLPGCHKSGTIIPTETDPVENSPQILTHIYSESTLSIPDEWNYGGMSGSSPAQGCGWRKERSIFLTFLLTKVIVYDNI